MKKEDKMEYSSLTDFDSKLSALKDPNCPGEIIDKIVMDDDFPWGSEKAEVAKDLIASHSNTLPKQLENLFKNAANKVQKHMILLNPSCPESLVQEGIRDGLYKPEELEILSKNENITSDQLKELFQRGYWLKTDENDDTGSRIQCNLLGNSVFLEIGIKKGFEYAWICSSDKNNKITDEAGKITIEKLLGHPDFPSIRVGILFENIDMYEWFLEKAPKKRFLLPIAKNVNCPQEILEKIITKYATDVDFKDVVLAAINNKNYQPEKEAIEKMISSDDISLVEKGFIISATKFGSRRIVLLPDVGAPERSMDIFSVANLIEFSDGLNEDSLKDWFENYRYDEGIPQGDEYYDNSIIKQVILPNGTKQSIEIQIEGITYEKEKINKIDSMKDFDILIEGSVDWSKGLWNTFTLELDDKVMFDETKITAEGELGVIEEYHYDGKPFDNKEDWSLEDGYSSIDVSMFLEGTLHEINIDEMQNELEQTSKDPLNAEHITDWVKNKIAKEKNIVSVKVVPESRKSIIRDVIYTNTDTDESSEAQEEYRYGYFILEMSEAQMEKIDLNNPKEFKVNDYKIIDWSLDEVTFDDSDWDADKIEELDDEGILDEESKYYIRGPLEITKMSK